MHEHDDRRVEFSPEPDDLPTEEPDLKFGVARILPPFVEKQSMPWYSLRMKANHYPDERLVFIDLETAGGETWRPIMQLAVVVIGSDNRELETYEAKLRFRESIADQRTLRGSRYAREVWKRCAKSPHDAAHELSDLLKRHATIDQTARDGRIFQVAQLVAHNAAFDGAFLKAWFSRMEVFLPASPRIFCTVQRAMWAFHEDKSLTPPDDFKLKTLCAYFGIPFPAKEAHDALTDVRATVALYSELTSSSAITLRDLLSADRLNHE